MEDQQIIALYFDRNEQAITETDTKYGKSCTCFPTTSQMTVWMPRNASMTPIWKHGTASPHHPDRFFAFLAKITRHKSLDLCDRKNAQKRNAIMVELSAELESCIPAPLRTEDVAECRFLQEVIRQYLRGLDDEAQYVFIRRYFYGDSISAIAAAVKRSESGVTSVLHRLRQKLKKQLEKEGILL